MVMLLETCLLSLHICIRGHANQWLVQKTCVKDIGCGSTRTALDFL